MKSLARFKPHFTLPWQLFLLGLCLSLLFVRLGFWQLSRAEEKQQMLKEHQIFEGTVPNHWQPQDKTPSQYQQIFVEGRYLSQLLLLDNQHRDHQFGYDVISPLLMSNGTILLVDRGWIKGDAARLRLPEVNIISGWVRVAGTVYFPSTKNWILGNILEKQQGEKVVIELLDTTFLSQFLHKAVYPFIIRLGQSEAQGFVREWPTVAMPPERHYAYALQWFAFAFVIIIMILVSRKKSVHDNTST